MKYWDWDANNADNLLPDRITAHSTIRGHFIDGFGHRWVTKICNAGGCPYCNGKKVLRGFNDLASQYPELAKEYAEDLNACSADMIECKSGKKVWWRCSLGHQWEQSVAIRTLPGHGCPYCGNRKVLAGFNDMLTMYPFIVDIWSDRNDCGPDEIMAGNHRTVWLQGECGHCWQASSRRIADIGGRCPYCSNERFLKGFNDLQTMRADVLVDWNWDENINPPSSYKVNCSDVVNWKCHQCGHCWQAPINRITMLDCGCPRCCWSHVSKEEDEFAAELSALYPGVDMIRNAKVLLFRDEHGKPISKRKYEIDVIVNNMLAFEFNGVLWHSDRFLANRKHYNTAIAYHTEKKRAAGELNLVLAFIWEDDWLYHHDELMQQVVDFMDSNGRIVGDMLARLS